LIIPFLSALFVVLTSPYTKNPASAIGHIFLLEADSAKPYPLWNTAGYMADIGDVNGFIYIKNGVFGGFPAHYEVLPFYEKIEQYSDIENRDLWLYPLYTSDEELKRFRDTLSVWKEREYPYRFFTINCVDGIYNIFQQTLDSIPRPPPISTPQNFIELLNKSGRLGEPLHLNVNGDITKKHSKYMLPHKYSRLDAGISFGKNSYFQFNFRPLLHNLKDRPTFFTPFMEFEMLTLKTHFNENNFEIEEFWLMKILSISPQEPFSWMLNIGQIPRNIDLGIGQSYEIYFPIYGGILHRYSLIQRNERYRHLLGLRIFFGSFASGAWRYGIYGEYLRDMLNFSNDISINSWLCFDVLQNLSLSVETKWKGRQENIIDIMASFYF
jgi:hypothetical protein